jgi:hypothetical protein
MAGDKEYKGWSYDYPTYDGDLVAIYDPSGKRVDSAASVKQARQYIDKQVSKKSAKATDRRTVLHRALDRVLDMRTQPSNIKNACPYCNANHDPSIQCRNTVQAGPRALLNPKAKGKDAGSPSEGYSGERTGTVVVQGGKYFYRKPNDVLRHGPYNSHSEAAEAARAAGVRMDQHPMGVAKDAHRVSSQEARECHAVDGITREEKQRRAAQQERMEAGHREAQEALRNNRCPQCGNQVYGNSALTGWVQCHGYPSPSMRKAGHENDKPCSWQGFTQDSVAPVKV